MSEVASAYVTLIPSAKGFGKRTESVIDGELASTGEKQGKGIGSRMGGALTRTLKVGAVAAGAAVVGVVGTALVKGFSRLQGIEQAEAKLAGLGHTAKGVDQIMKNALNSVKGTAFGLDQAATVAASAVAAGVKPGAELEKTLTLVGDAATIAGVGMDEMGAIFNKVAASNKIQGDVIAQLNDAGIPIVQLLGKEMGTTAEETLKLASEGKVNFETFQKAMDAGLGGAAQKSGKTFAGSLANMQAALGRLGASVLSGVFSKLPVVFGKVTERLDALGPAAERMGELVGSALSRIGPAFDQVRTAVAPVVALIGEKLQPVLQRVGDFLRANPKFVKAFAIALGVLAAAVGVVSLAVTLFSIALNSTGIPLVIIAIAALVAGLVLAYQRSAQFRSIVQSVGAVMRSFGAWVRDVLVPVVVDLVRQVGKKLQPVLKALGVLFRDTILPLVQDAIAKFREWQPAIQRASALLVKIIAWLAKFYVTVLSKVLPVLIRFAGFLIRTLVGAITAVVGWISRIVGALRGFGRALASAAGQVSRFASGLRARFDAAVRFVKGIPGRITSALGSLGGLLYGAGRELIQGLIDGITSKLAAIGDAMSKVASKVKGFLPGSPVKEGPLRSWNRGAAGKRLMTMLASGITSDPITAAMNRALQPVSIPRPSVSDAEISGATASAGDAGSRAVIHQHFPSSSTPEAAAAAAGGRVLAELGARGI